MKGKKNLLLLIGIGLILASFCFLMFLGIRNHIGTKKSQKHLSQIMALLPETTPGAGEAYPDAGMPVLAIDGTDYVAILEVPAYGVTLPVADCWDRGTLYCTPGRFSGSAYDGTLVIGGADAPGQLSFCDRIENGAVITVTDMTGARFSYTVFRVDRADHAQAQWLMRDDCDLTLFCRDVYSSRYIAVRCVASAK